jgi:hypothetical protein
MGQTVQMVMPDLLVRKAFKVSQAQQGQPEQMGLMERQVLKVFKVSQGQLVQLE